MKIDGHIHITPPEIIQNWEAIAEREPYFSLLSHSKNNRFSTAEDVVSMLDNSGYQAAVVFGFAFQDMGLCRLVNDYVIDALCRFPDRLIGFMVLPPASPEALSREIRRCIDGGLSGVGELFPEGQGWDIEDREKTCCLAGMCKEGNLPVLIHGNEPVGHPYPGKTNDTPKRLAAFAEQNPLLNIIFAHWGGGLCFYEAMPEMRRILENVCYDTAATPFLYQPMVYDIAKSTGILHKVIFGSDYPLLTPARHEAQLHESRLTSEDIHLICGKNIQRVLAHRL